MKTFNLPLQHLFSLIQSMEKGNANSELASQLKELKEILNPLFEEYKDCYMMPDIPVSYGEEDGNEEKEIDWEQRRYELTKAAMEGRIACFDKQVDFDGFTTSIAQFCVKMADEQIRVLKEGH